jgi:hypothetical protein
MKSLLSKWRIPILLRIAAASVIWGEQSIGENGVWSEVNKFSKMFKFSNLFN